MNKKSGVSTVKLPPVSTPQQPSALVSSPKKSGAGGTIKSLAVLGLIGVGGYLIWKKIGGLDLGIVKEKGGKSTGPAVPAPDLKGPKVVKGEKAATLSQICVTQADPRFVYAPIEQIDQQGYQNFTAPVKGNFTRRLLCAGGRKWAEIAPKKG